VSARLEPEQQLIQQNHLSRVEDESLVVGKGGLLGPVEKVRVVGAFPEIPGGGTTLQGETVASSGTHTHTHAGGKSRRLSSAG